MRKKDPTPNPQPARLKSWRLNVGNRKPPPISLPRIRALEMPEPKEKDGREGPPKSDIRDNVEH
jgi:hypothetical protein